MKKIYFRKTLFQPLNYIHHFLPELNLLPGFVGIYFVEYCGLQLVGSDPAEFRITFR